MKLIATRASLIRHRRTLGIAEAADDRWIARAAFSTWATLGWPSEAGSSAATSGDRFDVQAVGHVSKAAAGARLHEFGTRCLPLVN